MGRAAGACPPVSCRTHPPSPISTTEHLGRLEIDGEPVELPTAVVKHFRNVASVTAMRCTAHVEVVSETFGDRSDYLQVVLQRIRSRERRPGVVFLDPDTGLEPAGAAGLRHVLDAEVGKIWDVLTPGDITVFYQHQTNRSGAPWIEPKKAQLERALRVKGKGETCAWDRNRAGRSLFFIEKNGKKLYRTK
jgi:hypothetical protein